MMRSQIPARRAFVLAVALILLVPALGPASPARADLPPDPAARLVVDINSILISNDRDAFGSGEMRLTVKLCPVGDKPDACQEGTGATAAYSFSANTGDTLKLDRRVPRDGDQVLGETTAEAGMPVYAGQSYLFIASIVERDVVGSDGMGKVVTPLDSQNNWGLGTYYEASDETNTSANGVHYSDFYITYDIRRASLPDIRVRGFQTINLDKGGQAICAQFENVGERPSGPVPLMLRVNGAPFRASAVPALEIDRTTQNCVLRSDLPATEHSLGFFIDEQRQVPEMNETNNSAMLPVPALGPAAAPSVKPSGTQADQSGTQEESGGVNVDLTVRAIKINGQAPDGKDDCRVGNRNTVAVVVKNNGSGDSGRFTTRLIVDGDETDATVDNVRTGEEREVAFGNVQMKKGERTLKTIADAERTIDESDEDNNDRTVSARCTDAS